MGKARPSQQFPGQRRGAVGEVVGDQVGSVASGASETRRIDRLGDEGDFVSCPPGKPQRWGATYLNVSNNSLSVFAGQITGVFGLVGAGGTETFKIVSGVMKRDFFHGGEVLLNDKPVRYRVPAPAVKAGIAYVTEDRKVEGFFETASIARNIYLGLLAKFPRGRALLPRREANVVGKSWIERLKVRAISDEVRVVELSGGNQQKVVIAKSLIQGPELIIFDEPTRGVNVGAIVEIHELINRLADEGKAVVVISSYLPEILALSDRILVSRLGKVVEDSPRWKRPRRRLCTRRSTRNGAPDTRVWPSTEPAYLLNNLNAGRFD